MPEGHTPHRLARDLGEMVGPPVAATSPQRRFPAEKVDGQRLTGVAAYGKHLLDDTANGDSVHVHLGMRGKWLTIDGRTTYACPRCQPDWTG